MKISDMSSQPVLLVDDEEQILLSSSAVLQSCGIKNVLTLGDSRKVLPLLEKEEVALVVLDLSMPHIAGIDILKKVKAEFPHIAVIMMTANDELEMAVECMKSGAFDYLSKPVDEGRLVSSVRKALEMQELRNEISSLKKGIVAGKLQNEAAFSAIITKSSSMRSLFNYLEAVAKSTQPILITGETGVGKELIAKAAHNVSGSKGDFVDINVAGLDEHMFLDTLFGHKKGAYTGADKAREGLIANAAGGTLFLDEIGDIKESAQLKLLRLLQERTYYPIGSDVAKQTDARIVVATNRDLSKLVEEGSFRRDLYYRLIAHHVEIPPLRERLEDIPLLLEHLLEAAAKSMDKKKPAIPQELALLLSSYHFPGNVRELQMMVFDAVARYESGIMSMSSFKKIIGKEVPLQADETMASLQKLTLDSTVPGRRPTLKEAEDFLIAEALRSSNGNQSIAASQLGISRQALNKRLAKASKIK